MKKFIMSAFASLIVLIVIATLSMAVVAYSNFLVEQKRKTTFRLEKMKIRVEELEDIVLVLDTLCEKRAIPKLINDEIIEYYHKMTNIDPKAAYLKAGLSSANIRSNELSDESARREISRICKSDAQIARYNAYLNEALQILRKQHTEGKIASQEIQDFALEIEWLQLQTKVISNIVQGHKAYSKQDILSANGFYKKAQNELLKSSHPDERRHQMINQMADILFGRRKCLDPELMPETEFNPENDVDLGDLNPDALSDEQLPEDLLKSAMMSQQDKSGASSQKPTAH